MNPSGAAAARACVRKRACESGAEACVRERGRKAENAPSSISWALSNCLAIFFPSLSIILRPGEEARGGGQCGAGSECWGKGTCAGAARREEGPWVPRQSAPADATPPMFFPAKSPPSSPSPCAASPVSITDRRCTWVCAHQTATEELPADHTTSPPPARGTAMRWRTCGWRGPRLSGTVVGLAGGSEAGRGRQRGCAAGAPRCGPSRRPSSGAACPRRPPASPGGPCSRRRRRRSGWRRCRRTTSGGTRLRTGGRTDTGR